MFLNGAGGGLIVLMAAVSLPAAERGLDVLRKNCVACHGSAQMSGLDLRTRVAALRGGSRGPALVAGKPGESLILRAMAHEDKLAMPPGRPKLAEADVAAVRDWITAGAPWDGAAAEPGWWSFRKVQRPPLPAVREAAWARNPVDAFLLAKLETASLQPAAEASREALARRLFFDLHGLPPTPEQIDEFAQDRAPDAYEKLVERLLASPRYGERWGRQWLDVVRYADTGGYETDILYINAWRYRDYVIRCFNEDKPYTEFVREQIAADELWPDNLDLNGSYDLPADKVKSLNRRLGTGLYTVGPMAVEYTFFGDQFRSEWQAEAVEMTGSAFLGLTMGCARCHDHKFDPVTQKDFWKLAAVFAGSEDREIPITSQMGIYEYTRHQTRQVVVDHLRDQLRQLEGGKRNRKDLSPGERDERETLLRKIGEAYAAAPVMYPKANVLAHSEMVPDTHVLIRGDFKQKGEKVLPGAPAALDGDLRLEEPASGPFVPQRRKAFAQWLTSDGNPLFGRVMVNRIWQGHFGRGLVPTANDFGRQGDPPTHPELLDWLAAEFRERGYSIKAMHRLMVTSSAYRMSSAANAAGLKADAENKLYWRANRRRLQAEEVRDAVLSVADALNGKAGGPPVAVPLTEEERAGMRDSSQWPVHPDAAEHDRRSVYLMVKRSFRLPMFETFDQPDPTASCGRREVSTVAPQALALLNGEFMVTQAARLAGRLRKEAGESKEAWIDRGSRLAFGRPPTAEEKSRALAYLGASSLENLCLVWLNTSEFLYVD